MFILDYYLSTSNDAYTYHDIFTCKMLTCIILDLKYHIKT